MDLPPLPNFLDDVGGMHLGRNKTGKAGNELKLRCTELDVKGNVTLMDGEFKKTELIAKVCVEVHDNCDCAVADPMRSMVFCLEI